MLDSKYVEENLEKVAAGMKDRGAPFDTGRFRSLDQERRQIIKRVEELEHERNVGSKRFGELKREGDQGAADRLQAELRVISDKIKELGDREGEGGR
jgi:seryl-tRNA synthetase